jgi:hypothetical protein
MIDGLPQLGNGLVPLVDFLQALSDRVLTDVEVSGELTMNRVGNSVALHSRTQSIIPAPPFLALIAGGRAEAIDGAVDRHGNAIRWTYTANPVIRDVADTTKWTITGGSFTCHNTYESGNDIGTRLGNGVDHDESEYPATISMQPVSNVPVAMMAIQNVSGDIEYWFSEPNGEDGTCPPE